MLESEYVLVCLFIVVLSAGCLTGAGDEGVQESGGENTTDVVSVTGTERGINPETSGRQYNRTELRIGDGWFVERSDQAGLRGYIPGTRDALKHTAHDEGRFGNGVYVTDYNDDGREDLVAVIGYRPIVFRNTGDGFSRDKEAFPDIDDPVDSALFFDYDNDGDDDAYLMSDESSVFLENTDGQFREKKVGLPDGHTSVRGASAADYTGNGCLDLFVVQAGNWREERPEGYEDIDVTLDGDNGNPNRLFAGDCEDFTETTEEAGIHGGGWSLTTSFTDFTNDGLADIHVANDFNNDVIYINNGDGTFERRVLPEFTNRNGMSSEVADINGDGYLDIFVSNIHHNGTTNHHSRYDGRVEGNNLLLNTGNGSFLDAAEEYGIKESAWGWAALFEDFDNDGSLDLYQATGMNRDTYFYFWERDEKGFDHVNGSFATQPSWTGTGVVSFDYDSDGRLDIVEAAFLHDSYDLHLYENQRKTGNSLAVSVESDGDHTTVGTEVTVTAGDHRQTRIKTSGTDYFSQDSRVLWFGLGDAERADIEVKFPNGELRSYDDIKANQRISVSP